MGGLDIGFADRDTFKRGVHWLFEDAPEDVLWVSFSTAGRPPGSFNNFRSLRNYPGKKLYISDPDNNYYQTLVDDVRALLDHVQKNFWISHAIYWGSSMGAYGALLFGILNIIAGRCYAFAPQLDLRHPSARANRWLSGPDVLHPRFRDLCPLLRQRGFRDLNTLFPCYDYFDGIHVEDVRALGHRDREIAFVGTSHRVLEDFVATAGREVLEDCFAAALAGRDVTVPPRLIPSEQDVALSGLAYACAEFLAGRAPPPDLSVDDAGTGNHAWLNAKQRVQSRLGQHEASIESGLRAIALAPNTVEYLFCTANAYAASDLPYGPMLAEGLYREALRLNPRHGPVRRSLVACLARRGLRHEAAAIGRGGPKS